MDLAADRIRSEGDAQVVAVRNPGGLALAFDVVLDFVDGSSERVRRTPATWQADGRRTEVRIACGKAVRSVTLDTGIFVDFNPGDNTAMGGQRLKRRSIGPAHSGLIDPILAAPRPRGRSAGHQRWRLAISSERYVWSFLQSLL
jgi:hypothetical protein